MLLALRAYPYGSEPYLLGFTGGPSPVYFAPSHECNEEYERADACEQTLRDENPVVDERFQLNHEGRPPMHIFRLSVAPPAVPGEDPDSGQTIRICVCLSSRRCRCRRRQPQCRSLRHRRGGNVRDLWAAGMTVQNPQVAYIQMNGIQVSAPPLPGGLTGIATGFGLAFALGTSTREPIVLAGCD